MVARKSNSAHPRSRTARFSLFSVLVAGLVATHLTAAGPAAAQRGGPQSVAVTGGQDAIVDLSIEGKTSHITDAITRLPDGVLVERLTGGVVRVTADLGAEASQGRVRVKLRDCGPARNGAVKCRPRTEQLRIEAEAAEVPVGEALTPAVPSQMRVEDAIANPTHGIPALRDQLMVVLADGATSDQAWELAASVGGFVVGGSEIDSMFQLGFDTFIDLEAVLAELNANSMVLGAVPTVVDGLTEAEPWDYADYSDDSEAHWWHHRMTRAPDLWARNVKGATTVGIVDSEPVDIAHEDLRGLRQIAKPGMDLRHATHVAGLACGRLNGIGLAGSSGGCFVQSRRAENTDLMYHQNRTLGRAGTPVVNMSMGKSGVITRCEESNVSSEMYEARRGLYSRFEPIFREMARKSPDTLYVFSAGNGCNRSIDDPIKAGVAFEPNVLLVASVNSSGRLSSFSGSGEGVDIAAPGGSFDTRTDGGDRSQGVFSTLPGNNYGALAGTSMAAPQVAGIASVIRANAPARTASDVAQCLVASAALPVGARSQYPVNKTPPPPGPFGDPGPGSLRIVNAVGAFDSCVAPAPPPPPPPPPQFQVTLESLSLTAQRRQDYGHDVRLSADVKATPGYLTGYWTGYVDCGGEPMIFWGEAADVSGSLDDGVYHATLRIDINEVSPELAAKTCAVSGLEFYCSGICQRAFSEQEIRALGFNPTFTFPERFNTNGLLPADRRNISNAIGRFSSGDSYLVIDSAPNTAFKIIDGNTYICLAQKHPVRDHLPLSELFWTSESVDYARCTSSGDRFVPTNARNYILRSGDGAAYWLDGASVLHPIPDGGTYLCFAADMFVLDWVPQHQIQKFPAGADANCDDWGT